MEKIISIIIPIYNVENYIVATIESLLKQNTDTLEVILVDDGSLDNSTHIAKYYAENHDNISYYRKENGGLASARNFGLKQAKGKYIHFLDGDDFVSDTFYTKVLETLSTNHYDILVTNLKYYYPGNHEQDYLLPPINLNKNDKKDLIYLEFPIIQTKIYRRKYIIDNKLFFQDHLYEDITFFTNSMSNTNLVGTQPLAIVYYTQRPNSIMKTTDIRVKDIEIAIQNIIDYYRTNNKYEQYLPYIETLALKNLLLASQNRIFNIPDKKQAKSIIRSHWKIINQEFPTWRKNKLLKKINFRTKLNKYVFWIQFNETITYIIFIFGYYGRKIKNRRKND
jgi:glycosyltransferase involved in cell wall biosynthesis